MSRRVKSGRREFIGASTGHLGCGNRHVKLALCIFLSLTKDRRHPQIFPRSQETVRQHQGRPRSGLPAAALCLVSQDAVVDPDQFQGAGCLRLPGQAGQSRQKILRSGLAFAAGIFAWFLVLALVLIAFKAAGRQITWAAQFTNPYFVLALSVVVLVFALNLFGVFEISLPQSATRGLIGVGAAEGDAGKRARDLDLATGRAGAAAALARSMRAFADYRKAQCDFVRSMYANAAASDNAQLACKVDVTRRRVRELQP
jgi:hypothetical protein